MMQPRLRVIILNYNRASLTKASIDSVLAQDYEPLDLVAVDNGSEESDYGTLRQALPAGVQLLKSPTNLGYAAGNNIGARFTGLPRPDYLAIINNDVLLPDPLTLRKLVTALEGNPHRVACSPLVDTITTRLSPEKQIQVRRIPDFVTLLVASSWWLRRLPGLRRLSDRYTYRDARPYPYDQEIECESINGSCFVIRMDYLEDIGYLDEGTFLYQEELILGKQILSTGRGACLVTTTSITHEQGATSGSRRGRVKLNTSLHMLRSEVYYCRKYLKTRSVGIALLYFVRAIDFLTKRIYQMMWGGRSVD